MDGRKRKNSQIPLGFLWDSSGIPLGFLTGVALLLVGLVLSGRSAQLGFFWFSGIALGFILQKARFCFTAAMRDPYLTGRTSISKALIVTLALTSIGFRAIMYGAQLRGGPVPGMGFVVPWGVHTAVGAFIFGVGMVIAGGCASGTLMRVGEGFAMQMIALLFFVVGSMIGAVGFEWWDRRFISGSPRVFLPDVPGWFGAIALQLITLLLLWVAADKFAKAKQRAGSHK